MKARWAAGEGQEGEVERAGVGASQLEYQAERGWWQSRVGKMEVLGFVRGTDRALRRQKAKTRGWCSHEL